ncbi:hypothetical protein ABIC63_000500 [Pseudacidovorax sp. 1753]|uniref:hypothetical protein n=1 Tax=Pseudacidovorax sp. 1753 TaxID=3156419 RepID=UPI003394572E
MTAQAEAAGTMPQLRWARQLIGTALVALLNPFVYTGPAGIFAWIVPWAVAFIAAGVIYGLYALFLTSRARAGWPSSFFMLAWVLLALQLAGYWLTYTQADKLHSMSGASTGDVPPQGPPSLKPFQGKLDGE